MRERERQQNKAMGKKSREEDDARHEKQEARGTDDTREKRRGKYTHVKLNDTHEGHMCLSSGSVRLLRLCSKNKTLRA